MPELAPELAPELIPELPPDELPPPELPLEELPLELMLDDMLDPELDMLLEPDPELLDPEPELLPLLDVEDPLDIESVVPLLEGDPEELPIDALPLVVPKAPVVYVVRVCVPPGPVVNITSPVVE